MPDNQGIPIFIYIFAAIILIIILGALILSLVDFFRELQYLNKEISCTSGAERRYWIQQRRRLWLSLLPFIQY